MIKSFLVFLFISTSAVSFAQAPSIAYLQVDEAQSHLWIVGSFGIDSGTVSIEDTTLSIVSWSDTLIVCNLPDVGKGAGGKVLVQTIKGISNIRMLSIFSLTIVHHYIFYFVTQFDKYWEEYGNFTWVINWRVDYGDRLPSVSKHIPFEISKSSFGKIDVVPVTFLWADSSALKDTSIVGTGIVDLTTSTVLLTRIIAKDNFDFHYHPTIASVPQVTLNFNSKGYISNATIDAISGRHPDLEREKDEIYSKILFPAGATAVPRSDRLVGDVFTIKNHNLVFRALEPLGETTLSLFAIDGRRLFHKIMVMPFAEDYTFDISEIKPQMVFVVLQTQQGLFTKKLVF